MPTITSTESCAVGRYVNLGSPSCPELPVKPSLRQPPPTQPYLQSVETNMQKWEQQQLGINQMLQH